MHSTRPLWQLEERVRNHLKLVSNIILAIMRPGCLILTATILRSSIKASRRQNIVHQGGATSCWLNTSRSRSSFTSHTEHLNLTFPYRVEQNCWWNYVFLAERVTLTEASTSKPG